MQFAEQIKVGLNVSDKDRQHVVGNAKDPNSGKSPEGLSCIICFNLVYKPLICFHCGNAMYCSLCIQS